MRNISPIGGFWVDFHSLNSAIIAKMKSSSVYMREVFNKKEYLVGTFLLNICSGRN